MSTTAPESQNPSASGLLVQAAEAGNVHLVEQLINTGVDVNASTDHGMSCLMAAAANGHRGLVCQLLTRGAHINAKRDDGLNALALAIFFGHPDVVRELLDRGADATGKSRFGTSLESWARARGFPEIARLITDSKLVHAPSAQSPKRNARVRALADFRKSVVTPAHASNVSADVRSCNIRASKINVSIPQDASKETMVMGSIYRSNQTPSASPGSHINTENNHKIQWVKWITPMTANWSRLTVTTLVAMFVGVFGTLANQKIQKLLIENKPAAITGIGSEPTTVGASHLIALKSGVHSMTPGARISSIINPPTEMFSFFKDSRDDNRKSSEASPPSPRIRSLSNFRIEKEHFPKSSTREEHFPAKVTRTTPESNQTVASPVQAESGPLKSESENAAPTFVQPVVRTPTPASTTPVKLEIQQSEPRTTVVPSASTPLKKPKAKVIRWP